MYTMDCYPVTTYTT